MRLLRCSCFSSAKADDEPGLQAVSCSTEQQPAPSPTAGAVAPPAVTQTERVEQATQTRPPDQGIILAPAALAPPPSRSSPPKPAAAHAEEPQDASSSSDQSPGQTTQMAGGLPPPPTDNGWHVLQGSEHATASSLTHWRTLDSQTVAAAAATTATTMGPAAGARHKGTGGERDVPLQATAAAAKARPEQDQRQRQQSQPSRRHSDFSLAFAAVKAAYHAAEHVQADLHADRSAPGALAPRSHLRTSDASLHDSAFAATSFFDPLLAQRWSSLAKPRTSPASALAASSSSGVTSGPSLSLSTASSRPLPGKLSSASMGSAARFSGSERSTAEALRAALSGGGVGSGGTLSGRSTLLLAGGGERDLAGRVFNLLAPGMHHSPPDFPTRERSSAGPFCHAGAPRSQPQTLAMALALQRASAGPSSPANRPVDHMPLPAAAPPAPSSAQLPLAMAMQQQQQWQRGRHPSGPVSPPNAHNRMGLRQHAAAGSAIQVTASPPGQYSLQAPRSQPIARALRTTVSMPPNRGSAAAPGSSNSAGQHQQQGRGQPGSYAAAAGAPALHSRLSVGEGERQERSLSGPPCGPAAPASRGGSIGEEAIQGAAATAWVQGPDVGPVGAVQGAVGGSSGRISALQRDALAKGWVASAAAGSSGSGTDAAAALSPPQALQVAAGLTVQLSRIPTAPATAPPVAMAVLPGSAPTDATACVVSELLR